MPREERTEGSTPENTPRNQSGATTGAAQSAPPPAPRPIAPGCLVFTIPIYTGAVNTETSHVKDEQLGTQENNRYESVCTNILKSYEKNSPAFSSENYLVVLQNVNMSYTKTTPKDTVRVIRTIANNNPSQEAFKEIYHAVGAGKTVCFGTKKICGDENINLTNTTPEKKEISEVKKKTDEKNKASQKEKDEDEFQKLIAFTKWLKDNDGVDAVCAIETNKKSKLDNALANPFLFGTKGELAKSGFSEKDPFILAFKQGVREAKIDVLINEAETVLKETSKDPLKAIQAASSSQQATAILSGHQEKIEKLTKINAKLQLLLGSLAPQERKDILTKERSNINNEIELQITTATTDQREFRKAIQSKKAAEEKPYAALKTELEENLKILSDLLVLSGEVAIPTLENAKNELEKTVNKITPLLKKDKAVSEAKGLSLEKITKVKKELIKAEVLLSVLHLTDNLIAMKGDANKLPEMQNLITTAPDIIANAKNILGENSDIVTAAEGVLVECRKEIQRSAAEENETLSRQANITEEQAEFDKLTQLRASSAAQAKLQESQHEESTKLTQSELENRDKIKKEFDLSQQETQGRKKIVGEGDAELAALQEEFTKGKREIKGAAALESEEKIARDSLYTEFEKGTQQANFSLAIKILNEINNVKKLHEAAVDVLQGDDTTLKEFANIAKNIATANKNANNIFLELKKIEQKPIEITTLEKEYQSVLKESGVAVRIFEIVNPLNLVIDDIKALLALDKFDAEYTAIFKEKITQAYNLLGKLNVGIVREKKPNPQNEIITIAENFFHRNEIELSHFEIRFAIMSLPPLSEIIDSLQTKSTDQVLKSIEQNLTSAFEKIENAKRIAPEIDYNTTTIELEQYQRKFNLAVNVFTEINKAKQLQEEIDWILSPQAHFSEEAVKNIAERSREIASNRNGILLTLDTLEKHAPSETKKLTVEYNQTLIALSKKVSLVADLKEKKEFAVIALSDKMTAIKNEINKLLSDTPDQEIETKDVVEGLQKKLIDLEDQFFKNLSASYYTQKQRLDLTMQREQLQTALSNLPHLLNAKRAAAVVCTEVTRALQSELSTETASTMLHDLTIQITALTRAEELAGVKKIDGIDTSPITEQKKSCDTLVNSLTQLIEQKQRSVVEKEKQTKFNKLTQLHTSGVERVKLQESQRKEREKLAQSELGGRSNIKKEFDLSQEEMRKRKQITSEGITELTALEKALTEGEQKIEGATLESEEEIARESLHAELKKGAQQAGHAAQTRVEREKEINQLLQTASSDIKFQLTLTNAMSSEFLSILQLKMRSQYEALEQKVNLILDQAKSGGVKFSEQYTTSMQMQLKNLKDGVESLTAKIDEAKKEEAENSRAFTESQQRILSQQETQGRKKIVGEGDAELAALGKTFTEGEQKIEGAALESEEKTTRELLHAQFKEDAQQAERVVQTRVKHEQEEYASLLEIRIRSVELAVNNLDSAVVNATNNVSVINTLDDGYFNAVDAVTRARNQLQDAYDGAIAILGSNASIIVRASEILINANKRLVIAEEEITRIAIQQEARPKLRKIKTERVEEFNKLTQAKLQKSQLGESTELTQSESKERQLLHTEFMKKTQQAQQLDLSRRETQDRKAIDDEGEAELITLQEAFTRREQEIKEKSEALQKEFKEQYTVFDANITNAIAILNAAVSYAALIKLREELETMRKRSAQDADGLSKEAATELTEIHGRLSTQVEGGAQDKKIQTEKAEQALHTINTTLVDANTALQDVIEIDEKDITKLEKQLPISQQILTTATTDLTEARKNVLPTHDDIAQANNQLAALQNKINEMTVIISQVKELQKNIDDALAAATQLQKNLTTEIEKQSADQAKIDLIGFSAQLNKLKAAINNTAGHNGVDTSNATAELTKLQTSEKEFQARVEFKTMAEGFEKTYVTASEQLTAILSVQNPVEQLKQLTALEKEFSELKEKIATQVEAITATATSTEQADQNRLQEIINNIDLNLATITAQKVVAEDHVKKITGDLQNKLTAYTQAADVALHAETAHDFLQKHHEFKTAESALKAEITKSIGILKDADIITNATIQLGDQYSAIAQKAQQFIKATKDSTNQASLFTKFQLIDSNLNRSKLEEQIDTVYPEVIRSVELLIKKVTATIELEKIYYPNQQSSLHAVLTTLKDKYKKLEEAHGTAFDPFDKLSNTATDAVTQAQDALTTYQQNNTEVNFGAFKAKLGIALRAVARFKSQAVPENQTALTLQAQVDVLETTKTDLLRKINEITASYQKEIDNCARQLTTLTEIKANISTAAIMTEEQVSVLMAEIASVFDQLKIVLNFQNNTDFKTYATVEQKNTLTTHLKSAGDKYQELLTLCQLFDEKIKSTTDKLKKLNEKIDTTFLSDFRLMNTAEQSDVNTLQNTIATLTTAIADAQPILSATNSILITAQGHLARLTQKLVDIQAQSGAGKKPSDATSAATTPAAATAKKKNEVPTNPSGHLLGGTVGGILKPLIEKPPKTDANSISAYAGLIETDDDGNLQSPEHVADQPEVLVIATEKENIVSFEQVLTEWKNKFDRDLSKKPITLDFALRTGRKVGESSQGHFTQLTVKIYQDASKITHVDLVEKDTIPNRSVNLTEGHAKSLQDTAQNVFEKQTRLLFTREDKIHNKQLSNTCGDRTIFDMLDTYDQDELKRNFEEFKKASNTDAIRKLSTHTDLLKTENETHLRQFTHYLEELRLGVTATAVEQHDNKLASLPTEENIRGCFADINKLKTILKHERHGEPTDVKVGDVHVSADGYESKTSITATYNNKVGAAAGECHCNITLTSKHDPQTGVTIRTCESVGDAKLTWKQSCQLWAMESFASRASNNRAAISLVSLNDAGLKNERLNATDGTKILLSKKEKDMIEAYHEAGYAQVIYGGKTIVKNAVVEVSSIFHRSKSDDTIPGILIDKKSVTKEDLLAILEDNKSVLHTLSITAGNKTTTIEDVSGNTLIALYENFNNNFETKNNKKRSGDEEESNSDIAKRLSSIFTHAAVKTKSNASIINALQNAITKIQQEQSSSSQLSP